MAWCAATLSAVAPACQLPKEAVRPPPACASVQSGEHRPRDLPPQRFAHAPAASHPRDDRAERLREAIPDIRKRLAAAVEDRAFPGLAAGVVLRDRLLWSAGFGYADRQAKRPVTSRTLFRIASISKTFVGVALLAEHQRGTLRWDDPVARFVPEVARVLYPTADSPRITLRHLVTHTAGIPRIDSLDYAAQGGRAPSERDLLRLLDGLALERAPGTQVRYSNLGAAVAALALARLGNASAAELVSERVIVPLGMRHTTFHPRGNEAAERAVGYQHRADGSFVRAKPWRLGAAAPVVGLYSNLEDLARYVAFHLAAWPAGSAEDGAIVSPASLRASHLVMGPAVPAQQAFGVFWMVDADPTLGHVVRHSGSTGLYSATIWMLPRRNLGVVLLANTGNVASQRLDELAREVLLALLDADPAPVPELSPAVAAAVETVKALMLEPTLATIRRRFSPRFLQSVPAEELAAFFERHRRTLGLCREHHVLRADDDDSAVVRLYCAEGELRVSVHVQRAAPHAIAGLILEAMPQAEAPRP